MVKDLLLFTPLVSGQLGLYSQTKVVMPTVLSHLAGSDPFSPTDCPSSMYFLIKGKFCSIVAFLKVLSYAGNLLQASTHRSMRATLKHVWGLVQSLSATRQHETLSSMSQEQGKEGRRHSHTSGHSSHRFRL